MDPGDDQHARGAQHAEAIDDAGRIAGRLDHHIDRAAAGGLKHQVFQRRFGDVEQIVEAECTQHVEARRIGAAGDQHAAGAGGAREQCDGLPDGAGSHHQDRVAEADLAGQHRLAADAERFGEGTEFAVDAIRQDQAVRGRQCDVAGEAAVAGESDRLPPLAVALFAARAGRAGAAGNHRDHGDGCAFRQGHAGSCRDDAAGEFVAHGHR